MRGARSSTPERVLAFGSDSPVESFNPFLGIHAAVTRRRTDGSPRPDGWYPEQRLTVGEAVHGFTLGAAYASYEETRKGSLTPGKLADLDRARSRHLHHRSDGDCGDASARDDARWAIRVAELLAHGLS